MPESPTHTKLLPSKPLYVSRYLSRFHSAEDTHMCVKAYGSVFHGYSVVVGVGAHYNPTCDVFNLGLVEHSDPISPQTQTPPPIPLELPSPEPLSQDLPGLGVPYVTTTTEKQLRTGGKGVLLVSLAGWEEESDVRGVGVFGGHVQ